MNEVRKFFLVFLLATIAFLPLHNGVEAQGGAQQAFGTYVSNVLKGMMADVWTAQQPNIDKPFLASPVAICTAVVETCDWPNGFLETGYEKGTNTGNVLQEYYSWKEDAMAGQSGGGLPLGIDLDDNTWYTFSVHYNQAISKWKIQRVRTATNVTEVNFAVNAPINFTFGSLNLCGAETSNVGLNLAVQCSNMRYRLNGTWTLFDYNGTQTASGCVSRGNPPIAFTALGWVPC